MKGYINSIETFGLVDGPGIRCVIFLSGCKLRCKYCHNPEMWNTNGNVYTSDELVEKIKRSKPYFKNNGGVTFSGGEPLLQVDFLIEICKKLKKENIHIALDTAGCGIGKYEELLSLVDLIIFDIKHTNKQEYEKLTKNQMNESLRFIDAMNKSGKKVWIRQVIIPGMMDNETYIYDLCEYLKQINNIEKIEFLPFHHLGFDKYKKLGIENPLQNTLQMDIEKCNDLYKKFLERYNNM